MSNSLPPNVSGKVRGYLVLEIENILWKTSKTFTDVKTNILWWGEKDGTLCEDIKIEIDKRKSRSSLATLNYNIKTTKILFQSYLSSCDPIQIDIFSTKTGDFIGSCRFCISEKFRLIKEGEEKSERFCASILSPRKFSLGEMVINLKVLVGDEVTMTNKILPSSAASWNSERFTENKKKKSVNALSNANSNKENIEVVGKKKQITLRQPKPYKVSTLHKLPENPLLNKRKVKSAPIPKTSLHVATKSRPESLPSSSTTSSEQEKRSSLFNFLSGASMSLHDERKFLTQLATLSPSQSIIESIDNVQSKVSKPKFLDKIDSIKITISNFDLNSVGKLEVQDFINKAIDHKFVLKCAITSKIFKSHQDIKIISSVFESAPQSK
ncbi:CLUMA_CG011794, isoform A [Clunio marinus]|uniref:CLUMA_CG011794, isoform A n=1 Tax=Clunio marinus TaxID=568069 RepID=A0A1J1IDW2_9DIPT|nr:CLUMA_CG011794, isoform A [Clunio marinus]